MATCKDTEKTNYGEILIVDKELNSKDSFDYCHNKSAILLPANNKAIIDAVSSHLTPCSKADGDEILRDNLYWRVGFRSMNGQGGWLDGPAYDDKQHNELFYSSPISKDCHTGNLRPADRKLIPKPCDEKLPFLCLKKLIPKDDIESTTTEPVATTRTEPVATTTTEPVATTTTMVTNTNVPYQQAQQQEQQQSQQAVIVFLSIFCALLLLLNIYFIVTKIMEKRRKRNETNEGKENGEGSIEMVNVEIYSSQQTHSNHHNNDVVDDVTYDVISNHIPEVVVCSTRK